MNRSSALSPPGAVERPAPPSGYSTKDVAALLGLSAGQVRSYVRSGFLAPQQGPRGEYYFSFQDLVLLRTAKGLLAARVPQRRIRLARLLQGRGETTKAESHYRQALAARPGDATAAFNLGVALQDLGRLRDATRAYETALGSEPGYADAHYNLAGVYEKLGEREAAFRHLSAYRRLIQG